MKLKIKGKIILAVTLLMALTLIAVSVIVANQSEKWFAEEAKNTLSVSARILLHDLENKEHGQIRSISALANDGSIINSIAATAALIKTSPNAFFSASYIEQTRSLALHLQRISLIEGFEVLKVYDSSGYLLAFYSKMDETAGWYIGRELFSGIEQGLEKRYIMLPTVVESKMLDVAVKEYNGYDIYYDYITITTQTPVFMEKNGLKNLAGFITVNTLLDNHYARSMSELTNTQINFYINRGYTSGVLDELKEIPADYYANLINSYNHAEDKNNKNEMLLAGELTVGGDGYYAQLFPFSNDEKVIGAAAILYSKSYAAQKTKNAFLLLLSLAAAAAVIGAAVSVWFSNKISVPITQVTNAAKKIADGDLEHKKLNIHTSDETGILADSFNKMAENLKISREEIEAARDNLEIKVIERTKDLEKSKEELEAQQVELEEAKEAAEDARSIAEEANKAKSSFLATMSHEIRTPMSVIIGFTDILAEDESDREKRNHLETIKSSSHSLLTLINDILDFSKIEAGKLEINNIDFQAHKAINHTKQMFIFKAETRGLNFNVNITYRVPKWVLGDEYRLNQILINILGNAFKFTEKGSVTMNCDYQDGEMIIKIADTGIGIPKNKQGAIFQAFEQADGTTTRKFGGTGLGLAITKRLIDLMGGSISIESEPGKGTEFALKFPFPEAEAQEEDELFEEITEKKKIAVIDDNPEVIKIISAMLDKNSYIPFPFENTNNIINDIIENDIDLILLDLIMPERSGLEVNELLKQNSKTAHIPVIACSMRDDIEDVINYGIFDYVRKPVDEDELIRRINLALRINGNIRNIFVVDDDEIILKIYKNMLVKKGYNVMLFNKAEDALKKLKSGVEPDLILLDLLMPGMDGFEFLNIIRQDMDRVDIPVIIVTGKKLTPQESSDLKKKCLDVYSKSTENNKKIIGVLNNVFKEQKRKKTADAQGISGEEMIKKWLQGVGEDLDMQNIVLEAITELPEQISKLEKAVDENDKKEIKSISHSMKGTYGTLEMSEIYKPSFDIDAEINKDDYSIEKIRGVFDEMKSAAAKIPEKYFKPGEKIEITEQSIAETAFKILAAEDTKPLQLLISKLIQKAGFMPIIVNNGKEALDKLKAEQFDLLLLDMHMPVMDGFETIKRIRKDPELKGMTVYALTAMAMKGDFKKCIDAGCDGYITKPIDKNFFIRKIRELASQNKRK